MPASGHALGLTGLPERLLSLMPTGPIARALKEGLPWFTEPDKCGAYVVTLPETLPVTEALELVEGLEKTDTPVGGVIVNRVLNDPFTDAERALLDPVLEGKDIYGKGRYEAVAEAEEAPAEPTQPHRPAHPGHPRVPAAGRGAGERRGQQPGHLPGGRVSISPRELIETRKVIVCGGSGGVGKTTTATAIALVAATMGRKVLALTVDPSKRLAQTLGVDRNLAEPEPVPAALLDAVGVEPDLLEAWMLDPRIVADKFVNRFADTPEEAERLINNRLYLQISGMVAGMQEYMAMQALHDFLKEERYDLIVLDTPPSRNALDFLYGPSRLQGFLRGPHLLAVQAPRTAGRRLASAAALGHGLRHHQHRQPLGVRRGVLQGAAGLLRVLQHHPHQPQPLGPGWARPHARTPTRSRSCWSPARHRVPSRRLLLPPQDHRAAPALRGFVLNRSEAAEDDRAYPTTPCSRGAPASPSGRRWPSSRRWPATRWRPSTDTASCSSTCSRRPATTRLPWPCPTSPPAPTRWRRSSAWAASSSRTGKQLQLSRRPTTDRSRSPFSAAWSASLYVAGASPTTATDTRSSPSRRTTWARSSGAPCSCPGRSRGQAHFHMTHGDVVSGGVAQHGPCSVAHDRRVGLHPALHDGVGQPGGVSHPRQALWGNSYRSQRRELGLRKLVEPHRSGGPGVQHQPLQLAGSMAQRVEQQRVERCAHGVGAGHQRAEESAAAAVIGQLPRQRPHGTPGWSVA